MLSAAVRFLVSRGPLRPPVGGSARVAQAIDANDRSSSDAFRHGYTVQSWSISVVA